MGGFPIPGMGYSTANGATGGGMNVYGPDAPTNAGVGGNISVGGNVGGSAGNAGGVLALIAIVGGLAVLYVATRTIQGSR